MIYVYMNRVSDLSDKSLLMQRSVQGSPISRLHTLQVPKVNSEFCDVKLGSTLSYQVCITQYIQIKITGISLLHHHHE